jgi:hypothetical protein
MNFYSDAEPDPDLLQGDVLYPVAFGTFDIFDMEYLDETDQKEEWEVIDLPKTSIVEGLVVADFNAGYGMILNQSCDLAPHSETDILVASVFPCSQLHPTKTDALELISTLYSSAGRFPNYFYLPPHGSMPASSASLLTVQSYRPSLKKQLLSLRKASLSVDALRMLQEKIAYCFGRYAGNDHLLYTQEQWEAKTAKETEKALKKAEKAKGEDVKKD